MILDEDKIEVRHEKVTRKERSSKQKRKTVKRKKLALAVASWGLGEASIEVSGVWGRGA